MINSDIKQRQKVLNTPGIGKVISDLLLLLSEELEDEKVGDVSMEEIGQASRHYIQLLRARYKSALQVDSIIVRQMDIEQVIKQLRADGK